jgi:hypothetical protein
MKYILMFLISISLNANPISKDCTLKGKKLFVKFKIVEWGEDFKIKIVDYAQSFSIQYVTDSPGIK